MFDTDKPITKVLTGTGLLYNGLWVVIAAYIVGFSLLQHFITLGLWEISLVVVPFIGYPIYVVLLRQRQLRRRPQELAAVATDRHYTFQPPLLITGPEIFNKTSLLLLSNVRQPQFSNFMSGPDWDYTELRYKLMKKTKNGEYQAATIYYSVMVMRLPRELPNVFFDAKQARGRQFKTLFDKKQLHSLEGDFDTYFATYFPQYYTIDSMSFISPDVMWALRAANEYDIEIVGDRLYLYGGLATPSVQLPDMADKLRTIKK